MPNEIEDEYFNECVPTKKFEKFDPIIKLSPWRYFDARGDNFGEFARLIVKYTEILFHRKIQQISYYETHQTMAKIELYKYMSGVIYIRHL